MAGIWYMVKGRELQISDLVRTRRIYDGEEHETGSGDVWSDYMPEIVERWYVEDYRNGWITIAREVQRAYVFDETGERRKIRVGSKDDLFLLALSPAGGDPRWKRFGLTMPKETTSS